MNKRLLELLAWPAVTITICCPITGILFSISIAQLKNKTLLVVEKDVGFPDIGRRDGDLGNSAVIIGVPF